MRRIHREFEGGTVPKTILIVEDEIFVAMDIERILADAGYSEITLFNNAA